MILLITFLTVRNYTPFARAAIAISKVWHTKVPLMNVQIQVKCRTWI